MLSSQGLALRHRCVVCLSSRNCCSVESCLWRQRFVLRSRGLCWRFTGLIKCFPLDFLLEDYFALLSVASLGGLCCCMQDAHICGFILTEGKSAAGALITLDVVRNSGGEDCVGLLAETRGIGLRGVRHVLLETQQTMTLALPSGSTTGYGIAATLQRYYLGRLDAYENAQDIAGPNENCSSELRLLAPRGRSRNPSLKPAGTQTARCRKAALQERRCVTFFRG